MATSAGGGWKDQYGADFLAVLEVEQDWPSIQALWRWGSTTDLPALADVMARSGNPTLAMLLGVEVSAARYAVHLPMLPDVLHLHGPVVGEEIAARVLKRLLNEENPLDATYQEKHHLLVAWLMRQIGDAFDDLAIEIALGGHAYSDIAEPRDAAVERISRDGTLGTRLIDAFTEQPDRWVTGSGWTRTADVIGRIGSPKHRADLVRMLTAKLLALAPDEAVQPTSSFVALMERHGSKELASAFSGEPLPNTPGTGAAVHAVTQFASPTTLDDLVVALAAGQPALWSAYRQAVTGSWSVEDWTRMLSRWSTPGSVLIEFGEVIEGAPLQTAVLQFRVAVLHGTEREDHGARVVVGALRSIVRPTDDTEPDFDAVVDATPWDLLANSERLDYLDGILAQVLASTDYCEVVVSAYTRGLLSADFAVSLTPDDECASALVRLGAGAKRAAYATALIEGSEAEFVIPIFDEVISSMDDTFDLIEVVAEHDAGIAFGSFNETRWHRLSPDSKDHLVSLLEQYATSDEEVLLDLIAGDSEAANSGRRARAAQRWSVLATLHGDIPPGVFSLLDSARPDLNQVFAQVATTVQPRDDPTLLRLREKWIQGGKIGDDARAALDAVAAGVVQTLGPLTGPARRSEGPDLLRILGVTAAEDSFECLINHVGADAIDDDLGLRRAASSALRAFVDATRLDPERISALGAGAASEPDAEASDQLREALAAARMGEDAAILMLYDLAGLTTTDVTATPDDLFGEQKPRLLVALKRLVVQRGLGEVGWPGYVEQMDLVAEALVRTAYLRFGDSESLRAEIRKNSTKPDYGVLVKSLAKAKGFDASSAHLQSLHDMRSNRTAAHHPNGGPLDDDAVSGAVNALETAAREIIVRLQNDGPLLRAVEATP
ncbi:MAG: hypothetical protein ABSB09_02875 [Acidimicrobiales bacterium]|jgi:hypothetical protein